ncbi:hypothetical protein BYT27DRAFT_7221290 [Phlegmacium glaucopus]|nr:hypothetical protein BYT27DRAFT_7221290 [Phlegmacium glaucopus]
MASTTSTPAKSDSSFGQTLQFITSIKLHELEKQRLAYQAHAKVIDEANAYGEAGDIIKKVQVLVKAVKSWTGSGSLSDKKIVGGKLQLVDLEFWLQQAKKDPSFNQEIAQSWAETLEAHINHTKMRFDSAKLFGNLFNEWLASGDSSALTYQPGVDDASDVGDLADTASADFVEVGRKEMHEQKEKLKSIIFDDHPVDVATLNEYLEGLFEPEEAAKALEKLRKDLKDHGYRLQRTTITNVDIGNSISGLLASGQMNEGKRTTLKAFQENPTVLDEVASVLNMRLASLDSWTWPQEGVMIEMRRHLNGKYRAFTDPEIIDALLLHYIGVSWQVRLKNGLRRLFDGKAWKRPLPPTHNLKEKYEAQLRGDNGGDSIDKQRNNVRINSFFVSQLADSARGGGAAAYDDLVDAPSGKARAGTSPGMIKQQLLNIMTTECYLNTTLHGTHATVRSDLKWFGPSLPHTSILTVLEFLGMPKNWLSFYKAFLGAPVRFSEDAEPRVRKRGTPISYELSVVCGEALLFIMDFAVNQRADGLYLYRMHDDLWLWDADVNKCATGWEEMNKYAGLVGLEFNEEKTGSAYVGSDVGEKPSRLPDGDIRWGFLKFDPSQTRFVIDQKDVNLHIAELRRQLAATKSVFGWINAYNKYMAFFLRNFGGTPANCFGQEHVVDIIDALGRIQRDLFAETGDGSAVGYLSKILRERFDVKDLPEGYFYFPISSGGLELRNTMLEVLSLSMRNKPLSTYTFKDKDTMVDKDVIEASKDDEDDLESLEDSDSEDSDSEVSSAYTSDDEDSDEIKIQEETSTEARFQRNITTDKRRYARVKEIWDLDTENRRTKHGYRPDFDEFMSFTEYISLRESWLSTWGTTYQSMLESPSERHMILAPQVKAEIENGSHASSDKYWDSLTWYDKWVLSMYGKEVVKKFGGLEVVDRNLIPIGMVQLFKTSRMKLDQ